MARQIEHVRAPSSPAGHRDIEDRQRNRQTAPTVEHPNEIGVGRCVIIVGIADKPQLTMQHARKHGGAFSRKKRATPFVANPVLDLFELFEIGGDIGVVVIQVAQRERCQVEQDILVLDQADGGDIHDHCSFPIRPSCATNAGQLWRMSWR